MFVCTQMHVHVDAHAFVCIKVYVMGSRYSTVPLVDLASGACCLLCEINGAQPPFEYEFIINMDVNEFANEWLYSRC